jgi:hypothetical protein
MRPISPEEISALLDGELMPERAEEVRRALAEDERFRQIYEQMAMTDSDLRTFAAACQFQPHISLPSISPVLGFPVYAVALGLLIIRIVAKVLPLIPGIWLQASVIALVITWLLYRLLPILEADTWQPACELSFSSIPAKR